MAVMAGVFLDHVQHDPPQISRFPFRPFRELIEALGGADYPTRDLTLPPEQISHLLCLGGIDMRELVLGVVTCVEWIRTLVGCEDVREPPPLDARHVLQQAEQGERGGLNTGLDQLVTCETLALLQQRGPVIVQPCVEGDQFRR